MALRFGRGSGSAELPIPSGGLNYHSRYTTRVDRFPDEVSLAAGGRKGRCSRRLLPLLLSALLLPSALGAQHFPPDDDLEHMLRFIAEDGGASAIVFGILEADGTQRTGTYLSAGHDTPLGPHSVFEIGSITKTFTATVLADMVLRGEVALEDPVAKYLPEHVRVPSRGGREITLLDLATHRSGLPAMPDNLGPRNPWAIYPDYTVESLYEFLSSHELRGIPGAGYLYSNVNYGLLGHALARVGGVSFGELLRERILDPLGMDMTDLAIDGEETRSMVRGHRNGEVAPYWVGTEAFQGAGALRSTAEDMLKYLKANVGPPRTQLEQAMSFAREIRVPLGDEGSGYGFAWRTDVSAGGPLVMHGGVTAGFSARMAFMPEAGIGTILLIDERTFGFQHRGGNGLLFPLPPARTWMEARVAPEVLARYAGRYAPTAGPGAYDVRLEEEAFLTLQPRGQERTRLHATSDSTFYVLGSPLSLSFRQRDDGTMSMEARDRGGTGEARWTAVGGQSAARTSPGRFAWAVIALLGLLVAGMTAVRLRAARGGTGG
jgi:serine-type D-Ala-D-Ala carboxypeptidase/endopeptidase